MRSFSRFYSVFNLFAVAIEVALVWALVRPAIRSFEQDPPPLCQESECLALIETHETPNPRSFS